MQQKSWETFRDYLSNETQKTKVGRTALRRQWIALRRLADSCLQRLSDVEIEGLLGKSRGELDPENNDLKALVAYCVGKGFLEGKKLAAALESDIKSEPMAFLADHSGKSFGEKWAPVIAKYWLCNPGDAWAKRKAKDYYDADWTPSELGRTVRIELKASSEYPSFRFQQVRHPKLKGDSSAYDLLLCIGVTARSLEWWAIPTSSFESLADNGTTERSSIVIEKHHGKKARIWNSAIGYVDEGWFCTDVRCRKILATCFAESEKLRDRIIGLFAAGHRP